MEAIVSYLLMAQKYIKSKQHIQKPYPLCLGDNSKDFATHCMKKKNRLKTKCDFLSVDSRPISTNKISDVHIYLMKEAL